jgi:hypothetical protein
MSKCLSLFEALATKVFARPRNGLLSWLYGTMSSLITDSRYGSYQIEKCINEAYGERTAFFNGLGHESGRSGTKFAVTTMTVSTSQLYLLSSYNGNGDRKGWSTRKSADMETDKGRILPSSPC